MPQMPQSGADAYLQANPMPPAPAPVAAPSGFQPHSLGFGDKLGLMGDIFTGNPVTKTRLDEDFDFAQKQYASAHPGPMNVGGNLLQYDPTTGGVKTLYNAPPDLPTVGKDAAYLNGLTPGLGDTYARNFAANGGGQGPGMITVNGQQMVRTPGAGAAVSADPPAEAISILRADPSKAQFFDHTFGPGMSAKYLNGGAVPAAGPGGFPRRFPLYPASH